MPDLWDAAFILAALAVVLLLPKISPCCGCILAEGEMNMGTGGEQDCRKECRAFAEHQKKIGRR
jgi:hypothetical protein